MNNYIQIYKNAIDDNYCDELIKKFESNKNQIDEYDQGPMSFAQINLNQHSWNDDVSKLSKVYKSYLEQYKKDCAITKEMWPERYAFEQIRLKRYLPNDKDQFLPHTDAWDYESCKRFLVFFIYLDNNERGETAFPQLGIGSPCTKGSLLMFPPLWPWLHAGAKPINKSKYIIGSYLLFDEESKRNNIWTKK